MQTGRLIMANRVVVLEKQETVVIDVAVPSESHIRLKEHEKLEKYQRLERVREDVKGGPSGDRTTGGSDSQVE